MDYRYVRVSTKEQNELRRLIALSDFGTEDKYIYVDKQPGKDIVCTNYEKLIRKNGETIVIKSIDRLGRNYDEILEQWRIITKEKQVTIVVLDMPLLNTKQNRDLTGTLIADIELQLLYYVAQTERELIFRRRAEGIAAAKQQCVKFGRRPKEKPPEYENLKKLWKENRISARVVGKKLGVTHSTFLR